MCVVSHLDAKYWEATRRAETLVRIPQGVQIRPVQHGTTALHVLLNHGTLSIRHPNVASVFHLGRTGQNYFYAMEFVEGETVEHLIKRSGRLDVKLALEIVTQVAAGLAAVHK